MCALSALRGLERLRVYDDPGALPMDQEALELLSRSWPRLADIYVLGAVRVRSFERAGPAFSRLAHLDLFNQDANSPYQLQLHLLPPTLRALGVQNAVLTGATRASRLQSTLEGLSLYAAVHWPRRANGGVDMYDWIAGCRKLASLTIEYDMRTFADLMRGDGGGGSEGGASATTSAPNGHGAAAAAAATPKSAAVGGAAAAAATTAASRSTPLSRLAALPLLATLGCFFADSQQDQSAGVLDQRLVADLAALTQLEELEIWTVYGSDWKPGIDFAPLSRLTRLRSLKIEAIPPNMAYNVRRMMQGGVPYCKSRLVADNEMPGPIAIPIGGGALPIVNPFGQLAQLGHLGQLAQQLGQQLFAIQVVPQGAAAAVGQAAAQLQQQQQQQQVQLQQQAQQLPQEEQLVLQQEQLVQQLQQQAEQVQQLHQDFQQTSQLLLQLQQQQQLQAQLAQQQQLLQLHQQQQQQLQQMQLQQQEQLQLLQEDQGQQGEQQQQ